MSNGMTGKLFEWEVLGPCLVTVSGYLPYMDAMALAREFQPWDPTDPENRAGSDLHANVALALGLDDWFELSLYTAVNSPLDLFHGVDGWFEFNGRIVTLDLTRNPTKTSSNADIIIQESELDDLVSLGKRIANMLQDSSY